MARYAITTNANPFRDGKLVEVVEDVVKEGVVVSFRKIEPIDTSVRESRAKRHARKLVSAGRKNVMLWRVDGVHPVPIRYRERAPKVWQPSSGGGNGTFISMPLTGKDLEQAIEAAPGRRSGARLDRVRRELRHA